MNHGSNGGYEYGYWWMVILNSAIFIMFAFSFTRPKNVRDWRSFGAFSAFIVALFTEMYGIPLTIFFLAPWLQEKFPDLNLYGHENGHLWQTIFGAQQGDSHFSLLHILSNVLIFGGFILLSSAWKILYDAQKSGTIARGGIYAKIRHPQYIGFVAIMTGFIIQWPTIITLMMYPVLIWMYVRLAKMEEKDSLEYFGNDYRRYMETVPSFIPNFSGSEK